MKTKGMQSGGSFAWVCSVSLLCGCTTVAKKPNQTEAAAIHGGRKAAVLFRVTTSASRTNESFQRIDSLNWDFWQLDDWKNPVSVSSKLNRFWRTTSVWHVPSNASGSEGWRYLILEPGTYFVRPLPEEAYPLVTDEEGRRLEAEVRKYPAYHLTVPSGSPVVYAGSFHFDKHEEIKRGVLGFQERKLRFDAKGVEDETGAARNVSVGGLAAVEPKSSVATPCDILQAALARMPAHNITRIDASDGLLLSTEGVGDAAAAVAATPFIIPGALLLEAASADDDLEDLYDDDSDAELSATVAGLVLILAAAPFAYAADRTFGEAARKEWSAHQTALQKVATDYRMHEQVAKVLKTRLAQQQTTGTSTNDTTGIVMELQPYRLFLRHTRKGKYSLECGVRVRLFDATSNTLLWQNGLVYSGYAKKHAYLSCAPFETPTQGTSSAHTLDEYKWDAGLQLFRAELDKAVVAISEEIVKRLDEAKLHAARN